MDGSQKAYSPVSGITKREYFASLAMQQLLDNKQIINERYIARIAKESIMMADELLKALDDETVD